LFPQASPVRAAPQAPVRIAQAADAKAADGKPSDATPTPPAAKPAAKAATPKPDPKASATPGDADKSDADTDSSADAEEAKGGRSGTDSTIDPRGIRIEKGRKHVTVQGFGGDREYASFESFVQDSPWLAGLVFMVVLLVFLVPLL